MNQREREKTKLCHWSWSFACISPNNDRPDLKKVEGGHENKFRERNVWSKLGSGLEKLVCTSPQRIPRCTKTLLLKIIKPIYFEKLLWEESKIQIYRWYGKSVTNKCFVLCLCFVFLRTFLYLGASKSETDHSAKNIIWAHFHLLVSS